jgi:hypothetical protein
MPADIATAEQVSALNALNALNILLTCGEAFVHAASIHIEVPSR